MQQQNLAYRQVRRFVREMSARLQWTFEGNQTAV
jgi:hypothetical protein